ncbi:MAG: hypothetical protein WA476_21720, partial [Acidobacteriaceae bacterium]
MTTRQGTKDFVKRASSFGLAVLCALAFLLLTQSASAQANRGSITGAVADPSGAVVSGVTVIATNTATGVPATT